MERQENWKPIKGFEGLYDVSDQGRVYSYHRNKIRSPGNSGNGYLVVILFQNGQNCGKKIHRIVAEAFIPNPEGYNEVNHINKVKTDNRVENLEWCSRHYNNQFSKAGHYVLYDKNDERYEIYNLKKFARDKGLSAGNLFNVAIGKVKSYAGYTRQPNTHYTRPRKGSFRLISPDGQTVTFQNQPEAAEYFGCFGQNISKLLNGKINHCKGWRPHPFEGIFGFINENQKIS